MNKKSIVFITLCLSWSGWAYGGDWEPVSVSDKGAGAFFTLESIEKLPEMVVDKTDRCLSGSDFKALSASYYYYTISTKQKYEGEETCSIYATSSQLVYFFRKEADKYKLISKLDGGDGHFSLIELINFYAENNGESTPVIVTTFTISGSGNFTKLSAYSVNDDGFIKIESNFKEKIIPLHKGQGVWKGPFYRVEGGGLYENGSIWNEGDGNCCPTGGQFEVKIKLLKDADEYIFMYDKSSLIAPSESARYNQAGLKAYKNKDYRKAVTNFQSSIKYDKNNAEALSNLSLAYYRNGQNAEALKSALLVLSNDRASHSHRASALFNAARASEGLGDLVSALEYYTASSKLKPSTYKAQAIERLKQEGE